MITEDVQKLSPGAKIALYELDASKIGGDVQLFHGHNTDQPIIWRGMEFQPWAIEASGFALTGTGQPPTPTLRVGNIGKDANGNPVVGVISALCLALEDLVGATVTRYRTFVHYLDGQPTADPDQEMPRDVWLVEAKVSETKTYVEFELKSALDFDDQKLPDRQIMANMCPFIAKGGYRGEYCGYMGTAMFDRDDNPVIDPTKDKCGGRLTSCKLRFGEYEVINFGGFPSADTTRGY